MLPIHPWIMHLFALFQSRVDLLVLWIILAWKMDVWSPHEPDHLGQFSWLLNTSEFHSTFPKPIYIDIPGVFLEQHPQLINSTY